MNVLVLLGPNLNLLGKRPGDAPSPTLASLEKELRMRAEALKANVRFVQSNHEGALVDAASRSRGWADAVLVDPGPLAHGGWALREALWALDVPVVESQLGEGSPGEPRRAESIFRAICVRSIFGGSDAWLRGLEHLCAPSDASSKAPNTRSVQAGRSAADSKAEARSAPVQPGRSLEGGVEGSARGAKRPAPIDDPGGSGPRGEPEASGGKTIGRRAPPEPAHAGKSIGRKPAQNVIAPSGSAPRADGGDLRARTLGKIRERLAGRISPSELSSWAKRHWLELAEQRDADPRLEDVLQRLALSNVPPMALTDAQLLELSTELSA